MGVQGVDGQELRALSPATPVPHRHRAPPEAHTEADAAAQARAEPPQRDTQEPRVVRGEKRGGQPAAVRRAGMRLRIDGPSKRIVAQIMDQNNQVIKQIPPAELLKIAAKFRDLQGILFDMDA